MRKDICLGFTIIFANILLAGCGKKDEIESTIALLTCPENFVAVPANPDLGVVSEFCVAQFEMKNVDGVATSQAESLPWAMINQTDAKTACTSLGANYDLISIAEWMTIASDIEKSAANWSGGMVGNGMMNRGHSDNTPSNALEVTNTANPYSDTGNLSDEPSRLGWEQKRTHTLSNNKLIWDFAGNVWEWTDWSDGPTLTYGPTSCGAAWVEIPTVSCGELSGAEYMPANPAAIASANYNSVYGVGQFYGGSGGSARRGGSWVNGAQAGVFALSLNDLDGAKYVNVGFRCVFRHEI